MKGKTPARDLDRRKGAVARLILVLPVLAALAGCAHRPPPPALAPFGAPAARACQEAWAKHLRQPVELANTVGMQFALIPPGEFAMGSPETEAKRLAEEKQHRVRLTRPFYLAVGAVTQAQYQRIMGENPAYWSPEGYRLKRGKDLDTGGFPVERVSWAQAAEFCRRLSALPEEQAAGRTYRLPAEAEWEYACRAGTTTPFHFGAVLDGRQANMAGTHPYGTEEKGPYLNRPTNAGSYPANAFGLCDMHGNLWEWCADWYGKDYYSASPAEDPRGPETGEARVIRGGAWRFSAEWCRSAVRYGYAPGIRAYDVGFRVALAVPAPGK